MAYAWRIYTYEYEILLEGVIDLSPQTMTRDTETINNICFTCEWSWSCGSSVSPYHL